MKAQILPYVHSFPAPAVLIGCGTVAKPNLITCSWFGTVCSEPPMVSVSIRDNRFSYPLVQESGEFTVNIPRSSQLDWVIHCGTKSGRDTQKFADLGITPVACPALDSAPMIEECSLVLACKVKHQQKLGTHDIFIAEIVKIYCDEELVKPNGKADCFPEDQIVYLDKRYFIPKRLK
ncbi:flavin reductase family protein [bacterium]|nr:flavin reductase family protein [bacterium]MBU1652352.1 flavin reductase family protein [bacterium]